MRWTKPMDSSLTGTQVAQLAANEFQQVQTAMTNSFLGKTVNVVFVGTPTPSTFAVAYDAAIANVLNYGPVAPGFMYIQAKVNASLVYYYCVVSVQEFLSWVAAGSGPGAAGIAQIISTKIVQNYMAATSGFLATIQGQTFNNVTPQSYDAATGTFSSPPSTGETPATGSTPPETPPAYNYPPGYAQGGTQYA
jgi:hypothetical protein